jgi:hypothetical protein
MKVLRKAGLLGLIVAISVIIFLILKEYCPAAGLGFTKQRRAVHRLKNRAELPQPSDFDPSVGLQSMLQPGVDVSRWSNTRAAKIEGYVVSLANARVELANCYCSRDIHINLALRPDAPSREQVVVEITPRMAHWARTQGWEWSEEELRRQVLGKWCSFEGWLFFDEAHTEEAENTAPGRPGNWRATSWEIHPVTKLGCAVSSSQ